MLLNILGAVARSGFRRARRRQMQQAMVQGDRSAHVDPSYGAFGGMGPLAMTPFGALLEQAVTGPGGFQRSLAYDEATGQWVDISDQGPERVGERTDPVRSGRAGAGARALVAGRTAAPRSLAMKVLPTPGDRGRVRHEADPRLHR